MKQNVNYDGYRRRLEKAIENAKRRTNVTDVYNSMGISRANISGFLNGNNSRLSIKNIESIIKKLEDPDLSVSNQQRLSVLKPKKAANMLTNAVSDLLGVKISPNKKVELSLDLEKWLRKSNK